MQQSIIKMYKGTQLRAIAAFQADASKMAVRGYYPTSQAWAPGEYGGGSFIGALLLCIILIGFLIFIYMLIVKPAGTLTVTYAYRAPEAAAPVATTDEKTCPQCAEKVKAAAKVCRYCGHTFA